MISINTDIPNLVAQRNLSSIIQTQSKAMEKLSSGYRINSAADDAAGLFIGKNLEAQLRGYSQTIQNAQTASNFLAVADGALSNVSDMLMRARDLTIKASSSLNSPDATSAIQKEINLIYEQVNQTLGGTEFNGKHLFSPQTSGSTPEDPFIITVDPGSSVDAAVSYDSNITAFLPVDVSSPDAAAAALKQIDAQLAEVNTKRADIGAQTNRLSSVIQAQTTSSINIASAHSTVMDTDIAAMMSKLVQTKTLSEFLVKAFNISNESAKSLLKLMGT